MIGILIFAVVLIAAPLLSWVNEVRRTGTDVLAWIELAVVVVGITIILLL